MVFTSLVVEKLRLIMFLSQSVNSSFVLGRGVQRQSGLSRVKPLAKGWFQLVLVSGRLRQQASLFLYGHGRAAFPFLLLILLSVIPDSGPAMPYF